MTFWGLFSGVKNLEEKEDVGSCGEWKEEGAEKNEEDEDDKKSEVGKNGWW